jgi:hypothetical protein
MIRKTYSALALLALAGMIMVGCGKEDLTELDSTWGKKEGDVVAKLAELQGKNQELTAKFETIKTANLADTTKASDRAMIDQMLKDHGTATGEIEKTINDLKAKRDEALKSGKKADYEAAWKDAEAQYEGALKRIDELQSQNSDIASKIDGLSSTAATAPTGAHVDTAAPGAHVDTAAPAAARADAKKPAETAGKTTEPKADAKSSSGDAKSK